MLNNLEVFFWLGYHILAYSGTEIKKKKHSGMIKFYGRIPIFGVTEIEKMGRFLQKLHATFEYLFFPLFNFIPRNLFQVDINQ